MMEDGDKTPVDVEGSDQTRASIKEGPDCTLKNELQNENEALIQEFQEITRSTLKKEGALDDRLEDNLIQEFQEITKSTFEKGGAPDDRTEDNLIQKFQDITKSTFEKGGAPDDRTEDNLIQEFKEITKSTFEKKETPDDRTEDYLIQEFQEITKSTFEKEGAPDDRTEDNLIQEFQKIAKKPFEKESVPDDRTEDNLIQEFHEITERTHGKYPLGDKGLITEFKEITKVTYDGNPFTGTSVEHIEQPWEKEVKEESKQTFQEISKTTLEDDRSESNSDQVAEHPCQDGALIEKSENKTTLNVENKPSNGLDDPGDQLIQVKGEDDPVISKISQQEEFADDGRLESSTRTAIDKNDEQFLAESTNESAENLENQLQGRSVCDDSYLEKKDTLDKVNLQVDREKEMKEAANTEEKPIPQNEVKREDLESDRNSAECNLAIPSNPAIPRELDQNSVNILPDEHISDKDNTNGVNPENEQAEQGFNVKNAEQEPIYYDSVAVNQDAKPCKTNGSEHHSENTPDFGVNKENIPESAEPIYAVVKKRESMVDYFQTSDEKQSEQLVPNKLNNAAPLPPKKKAAAPLPPPPPPKTMTSKRAEFLVSFLLDSRGGAMTGCRGSGMRVLVPPGALEQPVRMTFRFLRSPTPFSLPLMDGDSLASRILEVSPARTTFLAPILVEIPYAINLKHGERELLVLRSDDGRTWKEHSAKATTTVAEDEDWQEDDMAIYQDVVAKTGLNSVVEDLDTRRVLKWSTTQLPKYFAIISRVVNHVKSIGPTGGSVQAGELAEVNFPANAIRKKIKVGLQVQQVAKERVKRVMGTKNQQGMVEFLPLVSISPPRRRFHEPLEMSLFYNQKDASSSKHLQLFYSISKPGEATQWEDVTDNTTIVTRKEDQKLMFNSKVSAIFWVVTSDSAKTRVSPDMVLKMYKEVLKCSYFVRLTVFYCPHTPHAWLDSLRIYLSVSNQMDKFSEEKSNGGGSSDINSWIKLIDEREVEFTDRADYTFDLTGALRLANEYHVENGVETRIKFRALDDNVVTLMMNSWKAKTSSMSAADAQAGGSGYLVVNRTVTGENKPQHHSSWFLDMKKKLGMTTTTTTTTTTITKTTMEQEA